MLGRRGAGGGFVTDCANADKAAGPRASAAARTSVRTRARETEKNGVMLPRILDKPLPAAQCASSADQPITLRLLFAGATRLDVADASKQRQPAHVNNRNTGLRRSEARSPRSGTGTPWRWPQPAHTARARTGNTRRRNRAGSFGHTASRGCCLARCRGGRAFHFPAGNGKRRSRTARTSAPWPAATRPARQRHRARATHLQ